MTSNNVRRVVTLLAASVAPTLLNAQQPATGTVALSGGVGTDQRGVRSSAVTLAPSLHFAAGPRASLGLSASATRFEHGAWSLGAAAQLGQRTPIGRTAALTLDASGSMSRLGGGVSATFAEAGVVPALEVTLKRLTVFGGVRAAAGRSSQPGPSSGLPFPSQPTTVSTSRFGAGPLYGASLLFPDARGSVRIGVRGDRLRVADVAVADHSVTVNLATAALALSIGAGQRASATENVSFASAGVSIVVSPTASLDFAVGQYPSQPITGTPAGGYATAGISMRFGGREWRERPLPAPLGAAAPPPGVTRLSILARDASRVDIAGDFTEWKPRAATRAANGVWFADLRIPPGQYRYAFRVNGREWRVPNGATAVDDGFGGKSAWLTVQDRSGK